VISFQDPVRLNGIVRLGNYTFMMRSGGRLRAVDLTSDFIAVSVSCQVKPPGLGIVTVAGTILTAKAGIVYATYTHTIAGTWQYQFVALDGSGNKLWGEPVQYTVYPNEEDASTNELLNV